MDSAAPALISLSELAPGATGEFFARLARKERRTTRDGKPYFRVTFQDAAAHLPAMIWHESPLFEDCETAWNKGETYRLLARHAESKFGPQLQLFTVRPTDEQDRDDGFHPEALLRSSRVDPTEMFESLVGLAREQIAAEPLQRLVLEIHDAYREDLQHWPAAWRNHHAFPGGYLEHVLSVTRTAQFLANKYQCDYPRLDFSRDLVLAGALLHDIGKLVELEATSDGGEYTPAGRLLGHLLLGRDIVRRFAAEIPELDDETLLRLEHIIISHQGRPEWGSVIPPSTPEALLVHYADDTDAKFHILAAALESPASTEDGFTSRDNPLRRAFYRGQSVM